jgi:hypothetical protein
MTKIHFQTSILFSSLFFISITFLSVSCSKNQVISSNELSLGINKPLIIEGADAFNIRLSDIVTLRNTFSRKVEIINKSDGSVFDTYNITVQSSDTTNSIRDAIRNNTLTGYLQIESEGSVLLKMEKKKGISILNESADTGSITIKSNLIPTCKMGLISGCVSQQIKSMGFFQYTACLYEAPACYGGLWALCTLNYCVVGQQR